MVNILETVFANGYVGSALIAAIAACIGVCKINKQTSFKLLTKKRLEQLEEIRHIIFKLRRLFEISYIIRIKQNKQLIYQYEKSVNSLYSQFATITSCYGLQETIIKKELEKLIKSTKKYMYGVRCQKRLKELIEQEKIFFMLSDMYTWALWKYIQRLYKSDKNLTFRFDKIFADIYMKTYQRLPDDEFFKHHQLKDLVNGSKRMSLILLWYKLRYKVV